MAQFSSDHNSHPGQKKSVFKDLRWLIANNHCWSYDLCWGCRGTASFSHRGYVVCVAVLTKKAPLRLELPTYYNLRCA